MPNNYIVATIKSWNIENFYDLKKQDKKNRWFIIDKKEGLRPDYIQKIQPRYIFFPHWSWIIPKEIYENFKCVVFHMTNLPYGRGGSPLQNLIVRGHKKTKISAIEVTGKIDSGGIYLKKDLDLRGNAEQIYKKAAKIIFAKMIPFIIKNNPKSKKQKGKIVIFTRRKPEQSKIDNNLTLVQTYNFIRMLDAEGYPKAFLETDNLKIELSQARLINNKLTARAEIYEK